MTSRLTFTPAIARALAERDDSIVITGGGGWLGLALLEMVDNALGGKLDRVRVYGSSARPLALRSGRVVECRPLGEMLAAPPAPSLLFHMAFLTRDRVAGLSLDDYVRQCRAITHMVAEATRRLAPSALFVPSSGAVYAKDGGLEHDLDRNPYGFLKREDETVFATLAAEIGASATIPRVFNIAGPFINKLRSYALSSIILDVLAGGPITLRAAHPVIRSYVHVADVLNLAMARALTGSGTELFDTAGAEALEVGDLAQRIAAILGKPDTTIQRPAMADARADRYVGDGADLARLQSRHRLKPSTLERQVKSTADYLRSLPAALL